MKKFLTLFISVILLICVSACSTDTDVGHEHSYSKKTEVGATCTEGAYTIMECACGDSHKEYDKSRPALGHNFADYVPDGNKTCTKDGTKTAKCTRCEATDVLPDKATGHEFYYYEENNDQTCTEDGTKTAKCEVCGAEDVLSVPKLGHWFKNYVSDNNSTCSSYGTKTAKCERCEETNSVIELGSKLPHTYVNGLCSECGAKELDATLEYKLTGDEYTVIGMGTVNAADLVIPAEYNGKPVVSIGDNAFYGCESIQNLTISEGVTSIGRSAFSGCANLASVSAPASLRTIGTNAFYGCNLKQTQFEGATYIEISANPYYLLCEGKSGVHADTKIIAGEAFSGNKELTSIVIPDGVVGIGDRAFENCENLSAVTLGSGLKTIGQSAFTYCSALTQISVPEGVTEIGQGAFSYCRAIENISLPNSLTRFEDFALPDNADAIKYTEYGNALYLGNATNPYLVLVQAKGGDITSCTVNASTKFIYSNAFYQSKLSSVVIPDEVIGIGTAAFRNCASLTSVTFGKSLAYMGGNAFSGCEKLQRAKLPESLTELGNYAFYNCRALTEVTLSENLTVIGNGAFRDCNLTDVTIPDGVTSIGGVAFEYCSNLKNVTIPDSVVYVGSGAFSGCGKLNYKLYGTGLYLGNASNPYLVLVTTNSNTVTGCDVHRDTRIIAGAFSGCMQLEKITLPSGVKLISGRTFTNCYKLKQIEYGGTVEEWEALMKLSSQWGYSSDLDGCTVKCTNGEIYITK